MILAKRVGEGGGIPSPGRSETEGGPIETSELGVIPFDAPLGAEIKGVDASQASRPEVVRCLKKAIADYGCVLIRNQELSEEQHVGFAGAFGDTVVPWLNAVELNTVARMDQLPGQPGYTGAHAGVVYFFNGPRYRDEPGDGYLQGWHADMTHLQVSLHYALLHAIEAPDRGYETWFSNQYLAYENLDGATKKRIDQLQITHSFRHVFPNLPSVVHPIVLTHPISRRRCIYGIPGSADACPLGVSAQEGAEIFQKLTAHLETEKFVYKHVWKTGDLMIWDNRCVLHRRGPQVKGETRILRRVMAGDGDPHAVRRALMGYA